MSAIILNEKMEKGAELAIPESFSGINPHNLWLYVKSVQAAQRANTATTKGRSEVRGGGKKPWAQKGGGRARAGSRRSPIFVGGGKAFGSMNNHNYNLKVNKKQKKLALNFALNEHAQNGTLFVVDNIEIPSGKTKDAAAMFKALGQRDVLIVKSLLDEPTFLAFENLKATYVIESNELNAYLAANYRSLVIEKAVFEALTSEAK
ncbi:50S ribosomal protein L4 [Sulfurimonas sp.]|jgi:large subunit ribosomal protein L4|uniref:50S ribosomal protein L4 n=1 Tax=Sulfurimonas sp. TaxID=2022749 RepID=UPI0025DB9C33|nr:50S ribosomal protein L4 [Sulfurimonas sp.]